MKAHGVGIVGLGVALPEKIRRKDAWSAEYVEHFQRRREEDITKPPPEISDRQDLPELTRLTIDELAKYDDDPFRGAVERRVLPDGMKPSDFEAAAGADAIRDAGLRPSDIDLMLIASFIPDEIVPHNGGIVHHKIGLPKATPAIAVDNACTAFLNQLDVGASCILAGKAKNVLLVQSAMMSTVNDLTKPMSPTMGDAASAVVLSRVADRRGLLGSVGFMDGSLCGAAMMRPRGAGPWYHAGGPFGGHSDNLNAIKRTVTEMGQLSREAIEGALQEAQLTAQDVHFFAAHQPSPAFNVTARKASGLMHTRTMDTYAVIGSIMGAAIPTNLFFGRKEGILREDDVVVAFALGAGFGWAAAVMRWGS